MLHVELALLKGIADQFGQQGWDFTMQLPNTPLSNIMDASIFPALTKEATSLHGLMNGGWYL